MRSLSNCINIVCQSREVCLLYQHQVLLNLIFLSCSILQMLDQEIMPFSTELPVSPDHCGYARDASRPSKDSEAMFPLTPADDRRPRTLSPDAFKILGMSSLSPFGPGRSERPDYAQKADAKSPAKNDNAPGMASSKSRFQISPSGFVLGTLSGPPTPSNLQNKAYIWTDEGSGPAGTTANPCYLFPQESQLNTAFAYGIDRGDGTFTRLLRADELDSIEGIPKLQGPEGLIILPPTRQLSPTRSNGGVRLSTVNVGSLLFLVISVCFICCICSVVF